MELSSGSATRLRSIPEATADLVVSGQITGHPSMTRFSVHFDADECLLNYWQFAFSGGGRQRLKGEKGA